MFKIAVNNLFSDKRKLILSCCGTMLAIILIIVCQSILYGTLTEAEMYSRHAGADIFVAQEGVNKMLATISFFPESKIDEIKAIEGVKDCYPIVAKKYSLIKDDQIIMGYLIGYDPDLKIGGPWKIEQGSGTVTGKEVIIDKNISTTNNIGLQSTIQLSHSTFKVVGFSDETNAMGNQYMFVPIDEAREIFLAHEMTSYILVTVDETKADISSVISKINTTVDGVDAHSKHDFMMNNRKVQEDVMSGPMTVMIIINFIIGSLIIGFSMYTISQSKVKDYAVFKAIGLSSTKLFFIVLIQALFNVLFGFIFGIGISQVFVRFINSLGNGLTATIDIDVIYISFVLAIIMSLAATFLPVKKINQVDPAIVFQS
jgi:putative ABC transport system permease protein